MPTQSMSPVIRERNIVLTLREPNLRPETQEYVSYLRAASIRALKGLPPDGTTEIRLWAVFLKLGARDPELAARLRAVPATSGPAHDAPVALWATHRGRVVEGLRRSMKPAKQMPAPAPTEESPANDPWKKLKFDITRVHCVDPQDGFGRGFSDELNVSTLWSWKGADGSYNDGISSDSFVDVDKGDSVRPTTADVTFVKAFKRIKHFPCRFSAMVILTDEDNGNIVGDIRELLAIVEDQFKESDDDEGTPWYVEVFEAIADWLIKGMQDDLLGSFLSEVTLDDQHSMLSSGTQTSGKKTATIHGEINGGKYSYVIEYRWILS